MLEDAAALDVEAKPDREKNGPDDENAEIAGAYDDEAAKPNVIPAPNSSCNDASLYHTEMCVLSTVMVEPYCTHGAPPPPTMALGAAVSLWTVRTSRFPAAVEECWAMDPVVPAPDVEAVPT
jgi:hypothetical protein